MARYELDMGAFEDEDGAWIPFVQLREDGAPINMIADGGGFKTEKAAQEFLEMLVKIIQSGQTAEQRLVDHLPIPQGPINPRDVN